MQPILKVLKNTAFAKTLNFYMLNLVLVLIALIAAVLILVVLIQAPKGRGLDASMGGGAANQILGASNSADFIEKLTWGLAGSVLVLCLGVSFMLRPTTSTAASQQQQQEAPAAPTQPAAPATK